MLQAADQSESAAEVTQDALPDGLERGARVAKFCHGGMFARSSVTSWMSAAAPLYLIQSLLKQSRFGLQPSRKSRCQLVV